MKSIGTTLTNWEDDFRQRAPRAGATRARHILGISDFIRAHSLRGSQGGRVNSKVDVDFGRWCRNPKVDVNAGQGLK